MSEIPDLEQLLTKSRYNKHTSDASRKEAQRRRALARDMARSAILNLHRADYQSLYQQALNKINAEHGPLPE